MRRGVLAALAILFGTLSASAQDWPTKSVRIIVPFAAGATPDLVARLIADYLHDKLGQAFIVENKPGASGNTGTDAVAKADPDGSTIGVSIGGPLAINTLLFSNLPYDPKKDLALITMLVAQPSALAVNASLGVKNTAELIDLIKRNPGKYTYGSIGTGSLSQLAMEAIALKAGTKLVHVPYPSSPQAIQALMRNDVQMVCLPAISITPQLTGGAIKMLAVSTAGRSALLPDVPTLEGSRHRRRGRRLVGPGRAGRRAGRDDRAHQSRSGRSHHLARHPRKAHRAIDGADPRHAGAIPRADRCRSRALGAGDRGGEYQDQLANGEPGNQPAATFSL